jgi:hypothetical protein
MFGGNTMNKAILAILAIITCFMPLASVTGDNNTPGDDLIETTFYGTVSDNETGEPIEEAHVYAWDSSFNYGQFTMTDNEGKYYLEFNLGGDFYLFAEKDDYYRVQENLSVGVNDKTQVDIELNPVHYSSKIFGTVTDSVTGDSLPDVQIILYIMMSDGSISFYNGLWTGADGKYSINVNDGTYTLDFYKNGYEVYMQEKIVISGQDYQLDVALNPFQQGIYGVVTNENGSPMAGISVRLDNDYHSGYNITDKDGKFKITVPEPGDYKVSAYASGHRPFSQDVTLTEGEMENIDIELQKAYLPDPIVRLIYRILWILGIM